MSVPPLLARFLSLSLLLCCVQSAAAGEFTKQEILIGNEEREYYVYIPTALKDKTNRPAIIAFHGYKSDAKGFRWLIQPDKWADKHGFVMIYPNAVKKSWNAGKGMGRQNTTSDDDRFAAELPTIIAERHDIDTQRIYAMGFSNGAQVAAKLLCHHSVQIAGVAMVGQSLNEDNCRPAYKVPVVIMHGMQDPAAPYKGGGKYQLKSHQQSIDFLRDWYEIKADKKQIKGDKTYKCSEYSEGKQSGTSVIGCSMFSNGHQWPGSRDFLVKQLGTTNKSLSANDFIMSFFKQYKGIAPYMGDLPATANLAKAKKPITKKPATKVDKKKKLDAKKKVVKIDKVKQSKTKKAGVKISQVKKGTDKKANIKVPKTKDVKK